MLQVKDKAVAKKTKPATNVPHEPFVEGLTPILCLLLQAASEIITAILLAKRTRPNNTELATAFVSTSRPAPHATLPQAVVPL